MTGADIRRLANAAYYMEIGEAEKLLAPLGDAARELVVMAICKLHHFAHVYKKKIAAECMKDAFILFDELRKVAPENGVTFGIPHLYRVRELCPKAAKERR